MSPSSIADNPIRKKGKSKHRKNQYYHAVIGRYQVLLKAHQQLDRAVDAAYGKTNFSNEEGRGIYTPIPLRDDFQIYTVKVASGASMMELSPSLMTLRIMPTVGRMLWQKNFADATLPA